MSKNFAAIGVAGYIAQRHLKAIGETGNRLVAATDKSKILAAVREWKRPPETPSFYGDGHASEKIAKTLGGHEFSNRTKV